MSSENKSNKSKEGIKPDSPNVSTTTGEDQTPEKSVVTDGQEEGDEQSNGGATSVESDESSEPLDPFDPRRLTLSQDMTQSLGVKKILTTVPVRKPLKEWFFRTHPDEKFRMNTAVVELKEERETYLVDPALWPELATSEATFSPRALITSITRQGVVFLWPIRLPGPDGKLDDWNFSALEAADSARTRWTRLVANMHLGAYDVSHAVVDLPEPEWPDMAFRDLLEIAFKGRFIDSFDHVVLKKLRGEL